MATLFFLVCGAVNRKATSTQFLIGGSIEGPVCVLSGCPVRVERRALEAHLSGCSFRRECPKGCGHMLPSLDQSQHNCVAELRIEVEMLRYALTVTSKAHCCCC